MTVIPPVRVMRLCFASTPLDVAHYSLPCTAQCLRSAHVAQFSTSPALWKRDNNKNRGLSALRHTGPRPRQTLSVKQKEFDKQKLPESISPEQPEGDPNHGLWGFFKDGKLLQTPQDLQNHGRSWTVRELRTRSFETLHALWWVCVKERNRLATEKIERKRLKAGYGDHEGDERDKTVQETMQAILDTLAERHLAWEEAFELARNDPSIDLTRTDGPQYIEPAYSAYEEAVEEPRDAHIQNRS